MYVSSIECKLIATHALHLNMQGASSLQAPGAPLCLPLLHTPGSTKSYDNKWKNHFYEMKGDVGMSQEGTRRCLHQDTKSLITPSLHLCFALKCCLFVCYECIRQSKQHNILTSNCLRNMLCCGLGRNKDVGMGLYMSDFVSWCRHLLVPSFFMKCIPLHCPNKNASREHTLRTRMRTRTTPP